MSNTGIPFNEEFCTNLEYRLCSAFKNSDNPTIRMLWCDGVAHITHNDINLPAIQTNKTREIVTTAWIGKYGQDEYKMTIHLGEQAYSDYINYRSIIDCIPEDEDMSWIHINEEKKTIEIHLR